ncbi:MAG: peptide-binding protein, partial [Nitrospinae bacterium]|nr:peptide-binding protein [Nitrospinota bacterium]
MKKIIIFLLLALVIITGCKGKQAQTEQAVVKGNSDEPAYGDALIVGSIGEPSNLIYMLASDSAS